MEINELKIELLKKILASNDIRTLDKLNEFLSAENTVSEVGEEYKTEGKNSSLSPEQWEELNRRYQEYLEGKGESESLEAFNQKIFERYGF
ncbi:hypothetical protein LZ575_13755 [Antarcticibacterium sp. 1MA-6-2]|uniref:hypothetical protein n=1 Tax=Antarcticibacterium sp. 1MA-6-2 TaxID=2908210 RepID=UPI001F353C37|nr:hypothetical protein [Antarcticibacterium sp. 1MA-6-2]UJH90006.1 hypothetical protein LZ575_13755 [Antarcticibacterium sp. 1MA-6-2]